MRRLAGGRQQAAQDDDAEMVRRLGIPYDHRNPAALPIRTASLSGIFIASTGSCRNPGRE